jgi:hypothetical protein
MIRSTAAEVARHLDMSPTRVAQLVKEGVLQRRPDRTFDLRACLKSYVAFLRAARPNASAILVSDARAREIRLHNDREEAKLISIEDVDAVFADILQTVRREFGKVPGATPSPEIRSAIERQITAVLDRCDAGFARARRELAGGRDVTLEGDDA